MEPHEQTWVRLPLEGAYNVRELGGYPTASGDQTKHHRFLRADSLSMLTTQDERFLRDYGVSAVLDLRDASEVDASPDVKVGRNVVYANIPLLAYNAADVSDLSQEISSASFTLKDIYRHILENYEGIRACFRFIAEAPRGCVLFHCAVGKDRTGVLAMLLLWLAGVDKWDVVANYVQTWPNLMRDEAFAADWYESSHSDFRFVMESKAETIEYAYDLVETLHGDVENYLLECGVPDEDVAAVRRRLMDKA